MSSNDSLQAILKALSFEEQPLLESLRHFRELLLRANQHINLISRRESERTLLSLISDSLTLLRLVDYEPGSTLLDLGSGAGLPWIPQKLARPDLKIISVESNRRKLEFQRSVVRELQLAECRLEPFRLEELPPQEADYLVAKGVAEVGELISLAVSHLRPGGLLILPRGLTESEAEEDQYQDEFEIILVQRYAPPPPAPEANLLLLRKI
ncbi:MAG: RsmG family class I SAM-dependent methyltransferase [bacterium]